MERKIKQFSDRQLLNNKIADLLFENIDEISAQVAVKQAVAKEFYETQFAFDNKLSSTR